MNFSSLYVNKWYYRFIDNEKIIKNNVYFLMTSIEFKHDYALYRTYLMLKWNEIQKY